MNSIRPRDAALTLATAVAVLFAVAPATRPAPASAQTASAAPPASPAPTPATTPIPSPAPSPTPAPTPTRRSGERHHAQDDEPSPTPTPTSPAFTTLDGYWEVVVQTPEKYTYSNFVLHQAGDEITGTWTRDGKKMPLEGNYDGRQFKFVAHDSAHDLTLAGYVEGATDMVGIVDDGTPGGDPPAFTASHREAETITIFPKRSKK
ncbi:MAG TPA: hypothetical protein VGD50_03295 [Candidatus Baltobacteraceae bacterium]